MIARGRQRAEDGAIAVIVAASSLFLFAAAAVAVDLGNGFVRDRDVQAQADFAALAAADKLPDQTAAIQQVADYLNRNQPQDDRSRTCLASATCVAAGDLTDGNVTNGEVTFTGDEMRVVSPQAKVQFGIAGALGAKSVMVQQDATVMVGSPDGLGVLPMYVATGNNCDFGLQTLQQPSDGHKVPPSVPELYANDDSNANALDDIETYDGGLPAVTIARDSTTAYIRLHGTYKDAVSVGFFNDDKSNPVQQPRATWTAPAGTTAYSGNNKWIDVPVPTSVTAVEDVWWVRVYQSGVNKWSSRSEARPLSVGYAPFECVSGATDGNFGTVKLPRSDSDNVSNADGWISRNMASGLQPPLTLNRYPNPMAIWECSSANTEAVITKSTKPIQLKEGTNCIDTDTGLTKDTVTPGLVTGSTTSPAYEGLLVSDNSSSDPDGSGGCSRDGNTQAKSIIIGTGSKKKTYSLNDDLLTCFFTDPTTEIGDVAKATYVGDPKFSAAIYESPRFAWVPVFGKLASKGGSAMYQIVDFRPTFITDQPLSASKSDPQVNAGTDNGLGWTSTGDIERLKVVYLNVNALPNGEANTPIGPYLGVGPRVIRLID